MARRRQGKSEPKISTLVKRDVAAKIDRARKARENARHSERVPKEFERPATKTQREELKRHGFHVTDKGVVVAGPRNNRGKSIPGTRVDILKGGVVKTTIGNRRDFIYGMTKAEKKKFAKDPEAFTALKLRELKEKYPTLRVRKVQTRLQWGAYSGTKDFAPDYWSRFSSGQYFLAQTPEMKRRKDKGILADRLTGLRFIVHTKGKRPGSGNKKAKGGKKK